MCPATHTRWRRRMGCLQLQVSFRKRATNYRVLLRKMTYEDTASCASCNTCKRHARVGFALIARTTTHCNTLQRTATHSVADSITRRAHTATYCNILQHTAAHCNTLQHTCNTLQHSATRKAHTLCVSRCKCDKIHPHVIHDHSFTSVA